MMKTLAVSLVLSTAGHAYGDVGGHVGVAVPMVKVASETTTVGDGLTLAHPIGVTVKKSPRLAIDFEVVVANPVQNGGMTSFMVDPGVVYDWGSFATGLRLAMTVGTTSNYGLIPLINKGWSIGHDSKWFVEAAFPTMFDVDARKTSFTAVLHTGIGF